MISVFSVFFFCTSAVYVYWLLGFFIGLFLLKRRGCARMDRPVSVIIAARNEEDAILPCLRSVLKQTYPAEMTEVIVVDDASDDRTGRLVTELAREEPRLKYIRVDGTDGHAGKKAALTAGIGQAAGEYLLFTDADCLVQPGWIAGIMSCFTPDTGAVAGATFINPEDERSLFIRVQSLDVIALITAGAGSIGTGRPVICNGSNLAYRKSVFHEVGGFSGIEKVISGDDDMFIQKVRLQTGWKTAFCTAPETYNRTEPAPTPPAFLRQRIRWSSTGAHYPDRPFSLFLAVTFIHYILALAALPVIVLVPGARVFLLFLLASKTAVELMVLVRGCFLFGRPDLLRAAPVFALIQMPYILLASTIGLFSGKKWS